jgi:uncharacterized protein
MNANCPRCGGGLTDRPFGSITLDGCTSCGGVWFDRDELRQLAQESGTGLLEAELAFQDAAGTTTTTGAMLCPRCSIGLYAFSFPHTPDVELDACRQCKGIWLDDGELQKIAMRASASRAVTQPVVQSPAGINMVDTARQQLRSAASFLITRPCPNCRESNPAASPLCWACGTSMQTKGVMALCPRCDRSMSQFKPDTAPMSLDACLNCKGIWFAGGELSTFLRFGLGEIQTVRQRIGDGLGHFVDRRVEETGLLSCPSCNFCMAREPLGADSAGMIDVCPTCKGVWLDAGELVRAYEAYQLGGVVGAPSSADPWR